ncbi:UNVERIFIED_CONTAM: fatty acid alpha-hydroxylase [Siphonaria sp. JEL0065]|nr:fatty acid alpha-hydroxylase [Siphonaria sp. JEL0065]
MSTTTDVYSMEQVEQHCTAKSVWVTYKGKVYDVTEFAVDHPGGADLVLQHAGTDIEEVMGDADSHNHSASAYEMLEEYCIGVLSEDGIKKRHGVSIKHTDDVQKGVALGMAKKSDKFIDTSKPMLAQVFFAKWSKDFYVEQVHLPRQVKGSAPLFGNFLEFLSLAPWYVIPIVYIPISSYNVWYAVTALEQPLVNVPIFFAVGLLLWTFIEYSLHRFAFHLDEFLPDNQIAFTLHFLLHGIHHFLPMDKMRLVMPPALGLTLSLPVYHTVLSVFPVGINHIVIAGAYCGFMLYDMVHYHLHHARPFTAHLREMKTYHLDHHYKNANLGYGITSKLWDIVFGTELK